MSGPRGSIHRIFTRLRATGLALTALLSGSSARAVGASSEGALQLVETWPVEVPRTGELTLPTTHEAWIDLIDGAHTRIDLAHFYASNAPGSRLEPVVEALERAAERGVEIRWIGEDRFYATYPQTLDRLDAIEGIEVRRLRTTELLGGVLHTKTMLVDGTTACIGSQNFDWRALEHIVELGIRVREPHTVALFDQVFELDWRLAGGEDVEDLRTEWTFDPSAFPADVDHGGEAVRIRPVLSPPGFVPDASLWDLTHLLDAIGSARESVRAQMLSYDPVTPDGRHWPALDNALRDAAARGVRVELMVSHWNTRAGEIEHLQSLQCIPGIEVRVATVPPWSGGFLPFARVLHAKTLSVDGRWAWIGTSNWSRSYFHGGRHHGLVVEGASFAAEIDACFDRVWSAEWTETVDPARSYPAPRVAE